MDPNIDREVRERGAPKAANEVVDRAQIRQQLALTPDERLASVVNVSRALASAQALQEEIARPGG